MSQTESNKTLVNVTDATPATQPTRPAPVVATVQRLVERLEEKGFTFPEDYSVANALASAKLALQEVKDRNDRKIVDDSGRPTGVVTEASMVNAVFDMCVQGLTVAKKQGYFIVYGNQLVFQRSYFGDVALTARIMPGVRVYADVIRKGDEFASEKLRSRFAGMIDTVSRHVKPFPQTSQEIVGAYCGLVDTETGEDLGIVLMDIDRIKRSWSMSKTYKADGNGTHNRFPDEMALRTVTRRRLKPIINGSTDAYLLEAIRRQDMDAIDAETEEETAQFANQTPLSLPETTPQPENVPQTAAVATVPADPPADREEEPF